MKHSAKFFANKDCEYYPCHSSDTELNCLFCYCPLYHMDCPGNFIMKETESGVIKSCVHCVFPHVPENYDKVIALLREMGQRDGSYSR